MDATQETKKRVNGSSVIFYILILKSFTNSTSGIIRFQLLDIVSGFINPPILDIETTLLLLTIIHFIVAKESYKSIFFLFLFILTVHLVFDIIIYKITSQRSLKASCLRGPLASLFYGPYIMSNSSSSRVEIFLDASNFYNGLRLQFGDGRYSVEKLVNRILSGRTLVRLNFYAGLLDPGHETKKSAAQQRLFSALRHLPFSVNIFASPLKYLPSWPKIPPIEKGVDTLMVQDLIIGAFDKRYDTAIILSGDQDFTHVVQLLNSRFPVSLETYYPASRRHLYESTRECFTKSEVITTEFYNAIR